MKDPSAYVWIGASAINVGEFGDNQYVWAWDDGSDFQFQNFGGDNTGKRLFQAILEYLGPRRQI